jgi:glycosyltransferase involved in cell wall biosynthesis
MMDFHGADKLHGDERAEGIMPDASSAPPTLSVVIPVYNEAATLRELIARVRQTPLVVQIVAVDDGSSDGSLEILEELADAGDMRLLRHARNAGKGAALRSGFAHATGDIVVIQDADLEYDPAEYPRLVQPIVDGVADVVYGSRFIAHGPRRVFHFWHYVANRALTLCSDMTTGLNLSDVETCYKAFRREVIESIAPTLKENRFGIDPELTAKIARRKYRVYEVGISYFGRTYGEGKKIGFRDALRVAWSIVRYAWRD